MSDSKVIFLHKNIKEISKTWKFLEIFKKSYQVFGNCYNKILKFSWVDQQIFINMLAKFFWLQIIFGI